MKQFETGIHRKEESPKPTEVSIPVQIETKFSSPVQRVWEAWSKPELVRQWWGPENYTCPAAKIDFRERGDYLFAMRSPVGDTVWSKGVYQEISPRKRIVCTDVFCDENGVMIDPREVGLPGEWPAACLLTVDFRELEGDETLLRLTHEGIPAEMHDDCVQGWTSSLEKMRKLLERH